MLRAFKSSRRQSSLPPSWASRKQKPSKARLSFLGCPGEDLNLHAFRHYHLKVACLPISTPGQMSLRDVGAVYTILLLFQAKRNDPPISVICAGSGTRTRTTVLESRNFKSPMSTIPSSRQCRHDSIKWLDNHAVYDKVTKRLGGEVVTLWIANPPCAGSIPARDS